MDEISEQAEPFDVSGELGGDVVAGAGAAGDVVTTGADLVEDGGDEEDLLVLESIDEPWELPVWEPTGQARVDEALEGLSRIDLDDVHTHADAYAEIHQQLRDTLSDLDAST